MHVHVPEHDILVPEPIAIPRLPLAWDRKCLQSLLNGPQASPRAQLDWLQGQIVSRAAFLHDAEATREQHKKQGQQLAPGELTARYEVSCFLNYLEDRGLFRLLGCDSMSNYLLQHWPGPEICFKQLRKYLLVARFIPEKMVESGKAGITLLWRVALVEHATVIGLLCEAIHSGAKAQPVGEGARKARKLLDRKRPLEEVLQKTRDALEGRVDLEEERAAAILAGQKAWRSAQALGIGREEWDQAMALMGPGGPPSDPPPAGPPDGKERRDPPREEEPVPPSPAPAPPPPPRDDPPPPKDDPPPAGPAEEAPPARPDSEAPPAAPAARTGEPVPPQGAQDTVPPAPAAATGPPAREPWWGEPFVRALLGVLDEPEHEELQLLLVRALWGQQPAPLISFIRVRIPRLSGVDPEVREILRGWIGCACHWDLEKRWPYLYWFFITAQLPHFLLFLHGLALEEDLPDSCRKVLAAACEVFPLAPQPVIPEGATATEELAIHMDHEAMVDVRVYHEAFEKPFECDVEKLAELWENSCDLRDVLLKLMKYVTPVDGPEEPDTG